VVYSQQGLALSTTNTEARGEKMGEKPHVTQTHRIGSVKSKGAKGVGREDRNARNTGLTGAI